MTDSSSAETLGRGFLDLSSKPLTDNPISSIYDRVGHEFTSDSWDSDDLLIDRGFTIIDNGQITDDCLLNYNNYVIVEYDKSEAVPYVGSLVVVPKCTVIAEFETAPADVISWFNTDAFNSENAYNWAHRFGNVDVMIDKVKESKWAYEWALNIGDKDVMIDRVTGSEFAFRWAHDIGNKDVMIDHVTESMWAYIWARDLGDEGIMIDRVTKSMWAYNWALHIGNKDVMIDRVTESTWVLSWVRNIGDRDVMKPRITKLHHIAAWNQWFPEDQIPVDWDILGEMMDGN